MKLLLCHSNLQFLARMLKARDAGPNLLISCTTADELIPLIAATEPHLVVIGGDKLGVSPEELEAHMRRSGFTVSTLISPSDHHSAAYIDGLWFYLQFCLRETNSVELTQDNTLLTERSFGKATLGFKKESAAAQENRLLEFLAAGVSHHQKAQSYLKAAEATEEQSKWGWNQAMLGGAAGAYLWRHQIHRYAATLAHYIPGVEIDCLPLPYPVSPKYDYLYTTVAAEAHYALTALRTVGDGPIQRALRETIDIEVTQEPRLLTDCLKFCGWAGLMRQVAQAHVHVLDACLANDPTRLAEVSESRHSRMILQTYCRWWNLTDSLTTAEGLQRIVSSFHSGRRAVGIEPCFSFYEFSQMIQEGRQVDRSN